MIPEGNYRAVAKRLEIRTTKKGTTLIEVGMEILAGDSKGTAVNWTGWLTEKAIKYAKRDLATMGHKGSLGELKERGVECIKNEVEIVVEHDEYNGDVRERVRYVNSLTGDGGADADWDKLDVLWNETSDEDDIPF